MGQRTGRTFFALVGAGLMLGLASPISAATDCKVKIDRKTGTINVSASNVSGPFTWGGAPGQAATPFANGGGCVASGRATKCQLGAPGSAAAITPPALCTVYVKDAGPDPECAAYIKGCTPGARSTAAAARPLPIVRDGNGVEVGVLLESEHVLIDAGGQAVMLNVATNLLSSLAPGVVFLSTDCTGQPLMYAGFFPRLPVSGWLRGTTLYYFADESGLQIGFPCSSLGGPGICHTFASCLEDEMPLVPAVSVQIPAFVPPFRVDMAP